MLESAVNHTFGRWHRSHSYQYFLWIQIFKLKEDARKSYRSLLAINAFLLGTVTFHGLKLWRWKTLESDIDHTFINTFFGLKLWRWKTQPSCATFRPPKGHFITIFKSQRKSYNSSGNIERKYYNVFDGRLVSFQSYWANFYWIQSTWMWYHWD